MTATLSPATPIRPPPSTGPISQLLKHLASRQADPDDPLSQQQQQQQQQQLQQGPGIPGGGGGGGGGPPGSGGGVGMGSLPPPPRTRLASFKKQVGWTGVGGRKEGDQTHILVCGCGYRLG